ncbi:glycosyl hydrolase family 18 protein [Arachidicoccus terrestris]|uniref:glycosyl hydrolase family 18 protein n=1 Tax=Arachidicoccus terrestris TaxID=2875539 RepID=UPI001CC49949|nr:glycosyl hydrolase family 18 protein [Arachidicoccus terrestris]UAY54151.1 ThuA domain-containing protein [Arachidicoccus terrestris]
MKKLPYTIDVFRVLFSFFLLGAVLLAGCACGAAPLSLTDSTAPSGGTYGKRVALAYVTSWSKGLPDPTYLTHINYAFGHVNATFNGIDISNPDKLKGIVALKARFPELKVCLSIGGWGSGGFSEMAARRSSRDSFATDCADVIEAYRLDGIDIDWEYPTSSSAKISSSPEDKDNFTLLMKAIRRAIGQHKLLTLASSAGAGYIDFKSIAGAIDFVNIMAYDMSGAPKHHSGLFRSSLSARLTADEAVRRHVKAGIAPEKLVLGIPFYGHGRKPLPGYIDYKKIIALKGYRHHWDDSAKAPYLTDDTGKVLLNYENPASITLKCEYIIRHRLLGAMFWEYDGDAPDGVLRKTVFEGLGLRLLTGDNKPALTDKELAPAFSVLAFFTADYDPAHISFAHEANQWLTAAGHQFHFRYDSTKNWALLNDSNYMKRYQVVLFLDNAPPAFVREGFETYMIRGGGFIGFHVSAFNDQQHIWDWYYNELLGCGRFNGNTWRPMRAILKVDAPGHPVSRLLPPLFESAPNEWYRWERNLRTNPDIEVLISIDSSSFPLGTGPKLFEIWHHGDYPVVWTNKKYHMLYVNMGHNDLDYEHKYGPGNGTLSHTFSSEPECRLLLNALFWLGAGSDLPDLPIHPDERIRSY